MKSIVYGLLFTTLSFTASAEGLSTHVLDTSLGKPGVGIPVELYRVVDGDPQKLESATTDANGRIKFNAENKVGTYRLIYQLGGYFPKAQPQQSTFLKDVIVQFEIDQPNEHYHVPLVVTPYSYSTYRGS